MASPGTMPEGAELRADADDGGSAQIVTGTETLATIAPPVAFDAQGQTVPARYEVNGDRLTITVDHRGGDFAYPILVDPVIDSYSTWRSNSTIPIRGWQYATPWPGPFPSATTGPFGRGLYISNAVQYFYSLTYGWWVYHAPAEAFIYRADFIGLYHQVASGAGPSCLTTGIINVRSGDWQRTPGTWQVQRPTGTLVADWRYDAIPRTSCQGMTNETYILWSDRYRGEFGEPGNAAAIQYWMAGNGNRTSVGRGYMAGSVIHMSDNQSPTITGGPPATATDPNQTWSFSFIDQGLGSYQYLIDEPGNPDWDQTKVKSLGCYGTAWSPCPAGWQTVTAKIGNLSPGTHTIRLQVWDAGNKITQAFRTITVNDPYPTSTRFGGGDYSVNTTAELWSLLEAVRDASSEDAVDDLWGLLSPQDADRIDAWPEDAWPEDPDPDDTDPAPFEYFVQPCQPCGGGGPPRGMPGMPVGSNNPYPGAVYVARLATEDVLSAMDRVVNSQGMRYGGRLLEKRKGRGAFPKATGSVEHKNTQGRNVTSRIVNADDRLDYTYTHKRYGKIVQIEPQSHEMGLRVKLDSSGNIEKPIGFIKPPVWEGPH